MTFCDGKFADWVGPFHFRSAFKESFIISAVVNSVSAPPSPFQKKKTKKTSKQKKKIGGALFEIFNLI